MKIRILSSMVLVLMASGSAMAHSPGGVLQGDYKAGAGCDAYGLHTGDQVTVTENISVEGVGTTPKTYSEINATALIPSGEQTAEQQHLAGGNPISDSFLDVSVGHIMQAVMGEGHEEYIGTYSQNGSSFQYQEIEYGGGPQPFVRKTIAVNRNSQGVLIQETDDSNPQISCQLTF